MRVATRTEVAGIAKEIVPSRTVFQDGCPLAGVRVKLERAQ
jgi:hypothetical protein